MNRRSFLAALGLTAFAPSIFARALTAKQKKVYKVARYIMHPVVEMDENGQRIGKRIIHDAQVETYVDLRCSELCPDTNLLLFTRADGTTNEFRISMEEIIEGRTVKWKMKECWRIVDNHAIEVAAIEIGFGISPDMRPSAMPPIVNFTWREAHWSTGGLAAPIVDMNLGDSMPPAGMLVRLLNPKS